MRGKTIFVAVNVSGFSGCLFTFAGILSFFLIKHVINMKRLSDEQHGRDIAAGNHTSEEEMIGTSFKGHGISLSC